MTDTVATDGAGDDVTEGNPRRPSFVFVGDPDAMREGLLGLLETYNGICDAIWSAKFDLLPPKGEEELLLQAAKRLIIKRLCSYPEGQQIWEDRFKIWRGEKS